MDETTSMSPIPIGKSGWIFLVRCAGGTTGWSTPIAWWPITATLCWRRRMAIYFGDASAQRRVYTAFQSRSRSSRKAKRSRYHGRSWRTKSI